MYFVFLFIKVFYGVGSVGFLGVNWGVVVIVVLIIVVEYWNN